INVPPPALTNPAHSLFPSSNRAPVAAAIPPSMPPKGMVVTNAITNHPSRNSSGAKITHQSIVSSERASAPSKAPPAATVSTLPQGVIPDCLQALIHEAEGIDCEELRATRAIRCRHYRTITRQHHQHQASRFVRLAMLPGSASAGQPPHSERNVALVPNRMAITDAVLPKRTSEFAVSLVCPVLSCLLILHQSFSVDQLG